ncbi:YheU family protein [Aestuariibacter salexigens]|uniref:YheU family protein n=1 Tax=Aestuariibacter salexigens TaxID=226010 RepID=UPI000409BB50|nr:YheU family protein [Aestuariibacter salexigens]
MKIPINELAPDTLRNVAEAFVLREGTDYGFEETSHEEKVNQVLEQLRSGEAVLIYSELHESIDIISKQEWALRSERE